MRVIASSGPEAAWVRWVAPGRTKRPSRDGKGLREECFQKPALTCAARRLGVKCDIGCGGGVHLASIPIRRAG